MNPLVSVIIPCFNGAKYLEKAVESVLQQTYGKLECIIVDDGSTDNTRQISEHLMLKDSRVKYFYKENGGISSARNFGINHSQGVWIQQLDADDWINHDKIRFQLSYLEKQGNNSHENIILYSDFKVVFEDENQNIVKTLTIVPDNLTNDQLLHRILTWNFKPDCPIHTNSLLYHRSVFKKKIFNDTTISLFEDLELWVHLLLDNVMFIYTPILGSNYRIHQTNITANTQRNEEAYVYYLEAIHEKDKNLLCSNPRIETLIKKALRSNDKSIYYRLIRINQNPVNIPVRLTIGTSKVNIQFNFGKIKVHNTILLKIIFFVLSPLLDFKNFIHRLFSNNK